MNWLRESLAKAMMYQADTGAEGTPAATLDAGAAAAEGNGGATDPGASGDPGKELTAPDWMTSVPKEFRDDKALWKHEDFSSYLKESRENSDKLAGFDPEKVVNIPGDDASDEDREAFYQKLGKPESAEGYELDDPGFPEGLPRDEELEGLIKQWAHEANMPADALKSLVGEYNAYVAEIFKTAKAEQDKALQESTQALKTELKDDYNEYVLKAQRAATKFGGDEFITLLKDHGLESHPSFLKVFAEIGKAVSEDSALGGGTGSGGSEEELTGFDGKPRITYNSDKPKKE